MRASYKITKCASYPLHSAWTPLFCSKKKTENSKICLPSLENLSFVGSLHIFPASVLQIQAMKGGTCSLGTHHSLVFCPYHKLKKKLERGIYHLSHGNWKLSLDTLTCVQPGLTATHLLAVLRTWHTQARSQEFVLVHTTNTGSQWRLGCHLLLFPLTFMQMFWNGHLGLVVSWYSNKSKRRRQNVPQPLPQKIWPLKNATAYQQNWSTHMRTMASHI